MEHLYKNEHTGKLVLSDRPGFKPEPRFPVDEEILICPNCQTKLIFQCWDTPRDLTVKRKICNCGCFVSVFFTNFSD